MQSRIRRFSATVAILSLLAAALLPGLAVAASGDAEQAKPERERLNSSYSSVRPDDDFINSSGTLADDHSSPPMFDLLILRPLGLGTMAGSLLLFVPSAILTLLTRPTEMMKPVETLVLNPARYVWVDPLGSH